MRNSLGEGAEKIEEEPSTKKMKMVPFYKLFSFADGIDIILMTLGTIGAIANGLSRPFTVFLLGELIDDFRVSSSHTTHDATSVSHASQVPLKFVYLALGCGVGAFLQVSCWMIAGERQATRVGSLYLKNILRQEIAYFDQHISSGEAIGRMTVDRFHFQDAIGENVGKFVEVVAGAVGGFVIAFLKGWLLTLALLSTCSLIFIFGKIMHIFRRKIALQSQLAHDAAANLVQQTIGSMRTVASLTGEKHAMDGYNELLNSSYKFDLRLTLNSALEHGLHSFISICTISFGVWFGARMILHNAYTPGEVFTIIIVIVQSSGPISLRQAYPAMVAFTVGQVAAFKMFEVINRKPKIDAYDANGKKLNDSIRGDIMLKDVFFSYPSRPKELILNGFSLFIPSGTTAALVGHSGSGKSTVISLIERFYDPQSGEILVDGIDVREFQLKWIRSQIGLVSQEPALFTDTIRENIAYGRLNGATLEEIKVAAELAQANDFINKLPQGLDTIVGENGIQLSGGQKQRIAIARAILKDPRVLLLDEATSALDTNSERIVQEALEKIMVNKTTVIVAHRLTTIRNAHTIAVLHQGKIVEKGTHLELLKDSKGVYSTLVSSQQLKEVVEQSLEYDSDITAAKFGTKSSPSLTTSSSLHHASLDSYEKETAANVSEPSMRNHDKTMSLNASREGSAQEGSVFQLAHLNKPEFPILIAGAMFSMITGATPLVYAFLISNVIKTFYEVPHKLEKDSQFWALMFLIDALASGISYPLKAYLFGVAGNKLIKRIRLKCFEKVINMEIGWFDEPQNSSAAIGARLSNDAAKVRVVVGDSLANFAYITSSIVLGMTLAFKASWQLSFIVLALIPAIGLNIYVQMKSMKGFNSDAKVKYEEACQVANDGISHIRTVSSFCAQDMIKEMHDMKCRALMKNEAKHGVICGVGFCISICFLHSVYAIILYAGAKFVQHRKLTASDIFRVFFALSMMSTAIYTSSSFALDSRKAKSAVASIFGILGKESKIDPGDESGIILQNVKGEIEVKHVNFSYPTRPSVEILRDFSLTIHSGQVVALVGESGSGKSTVISLLERFYDPDSGHITIDGIDISKFQVKWLRQQIGLVSQEPILLNNTIRANIASGKGDGRATEAEIIAAARLANAHEFVTCLQEGYDTIVGERGVQLSGGQKQRIAIARAIVKNPKILLLDEATSALDVESEKTVQEALDKVMASKSTIVVAHRLSTIKGADVIAVVKNGSIMEKGNHNTLVDMKDGLYSSLVRSFHM